MESWKNHKCMVCTAMVIGQHHPDWLRCCDLCAAVCWCKRAQPSRVPNISKYWFHWQVFESVPHMLSTYMYGCCTVSTLNLREGEIGRTASICFACPNVPLISTTVILLGWTMFERICLWRKSSRHLFFACLDTVHCQAVFFPCFTCIALPEKSNDLSLVLHKNCTRFLGGAFGL